VQLGQLAAEEHVRRVWRDIDYRCMLQPGNPLQELPLLTRVLGGKAKETELPRLLWHSAERRHKSGGSRYHIKTEPLLHTHRYQARSGIAKPWHTGIGYVSHLLACPQLSLDRCEDA